MQLLNEIKTLINAEVIRALTPIFIAAVGGAIGITYQMSSTSSGHVSDADG